MISLTISDHFDDPFISCLEFFLAIVMFLVLTIVFDTINSDIEKIKIKCLLRTIMCIEKGGDMKVLFVFTTFPQLAITETVCFVPHSQNAFAFVQKSQDFLYFLIR